MAKWFTKQIWVANEAFPLQLLVSTRGSLHPWSRKCCPRSAGHQPPALGRWWHGDGGFECHEAFFLSLQLLGSMKAQYVFLMWSVYGEKDMWMSWASLPQEPQRKRSSDCLICVKDIYTAVLYILIDNDSFILWWETLSKNQFCE